jgi:hypothetical protein
MHEKVGQGSPQDDPSLLPRRQPAGRRGKGIQEDSVEKQEGNAGKG